MLRSSALCGSGQSCSKSALDPNNDVFLQCAYSLGNDFYHGEVGIYLKPPSSLLPLYLHDLVTFVKFPKNLRHPLVFCQMLPSLTERQSAAHIHQWLSRASGLPVAAAGVMLGWHTMSHWPLPHPVGCLLVLKFRNWELFPRVLCS